MQKTKITIPDGLRFKDLRLARDPLSGAIEFDWTPIRALCAFNGVNLDVLEIEDNVTDLINRWYFEHVAHGGAADPVIEDLILEMIAEDKLGGGFSYQPGRA